jgi:hypothetical protein
MATNSERAQWARAAIDAYQIHQGGQNLEDTITDLVTDIFHYVQEQKLEPSQVAEQALGIWRLENLGPTGDVERHGKRQLLPAHFKTQAIWYALWFTVIVLGIDEIVEQLELHHWFGF